MRWQEIIMETRTFDLEGQHVFKNPSIQQLTNIGDEYASLRGLCDGHDVYVWNAMKGIHPQIGRLLVKHGLWRGNVRNGDADYTFWQCFLIRNPANTFSAMEMEWENDRTTAYPLKNGFVLLLEIRNDDPAKLLANPVVSRWLTPRSS
jgi:hypothetical protein